MRSRLWVASAIAQIASVALGDSPRASCAAAWSLSVG